MQIYKGWRCWGRTDENFGSLGIGTETSVRVRECVARVTVYVIERSGNWKLAASFFDIQISPEPIIGRPKIQFGRTPLNCVSKTVFG